MDLLIAIIFGIIQGITEFLPISSSGHLLLLHEFFELPVVNEMAFDVALHFATILAVILVFWPEIKKLATSFFGSFQGKHDDYAKTSWLIILATIPAGLAGVLLDDLIESATRDHQTMGISIVAFMLIAVAILFLMIEKRPQGLKLFTQLKWGKALFIGFAQALALIPGTSRSGITIIAGLVSGLKREEALKFSFLLSIPVILGASIMKVPDLFGASLESEELMVILTGFASAFVSGFLAIKYFLRFARNNSLNIFAYYRIVLALLLILYLINI